MAEKKSSILESILLTLVILGLLGTAVAGWFWAQVWTDPSNRIGAGVCLAASALALGFLAWTLIAIGRNQNGGK